MHNGPSYDICNKNTRSFQSQNLKRVASSLGNRARKYNVFCLAPQSCTLEWLSQLDKCQTHVSKHTMPIITFLESSLKTHHLKNRKPPYISISTFQTCVTGLQLPRTSHCGNAVQRSHCIDAGYTRPSSELLVRRYGQAFLKQYRPCFQWQL